MAAEPAQDLSKDEVKRRAMRRLFAALVLLVIAIGGLALLDHLAQQRRRDALPPSPPTPARPAPPAQPMQPEPVAEEPPAPDQEPEPEPEPDSEPPPPPEIDNAPVPGPLPPLHTPGAATGSPHGSSARPRTSTPGAAPVPPPPLAPETRGPAAPADRWAPAAPNGTAPAAPSAYLVQVGVFASPANAEALRDRLRKAGIDAHTETRVRIGPFATEAEAQAVAARLRTLGLEPVTLPQR